MIEAKHLTKRYGSNIAVDDLSFTIENGSVYGFLGPNGAGKSTTMNIITGCLGATAGEVLIDGFNILDKSIEAKRKIGYLPELPPLYLDMTGLEYLTFVAQAKGIDKNNIEKQINKVLDLTSTGDVKNRLLKNLSKGYRQRIGIAQALLGDPDTIILDEPTVGLDPAQIIEIRDLIKNLGRDHTVILSSHILGEVQAVCDKIMIISKGKLVASGTSENLASLFATKETIHIQVCCNATLCEQVLSSIDNIETFEVEVLDENTSKATLNPQKGHDVRSSISKAFGEKSIWLLELSTEKASLEDIFLEVTQGTKEDKQ
ncbi:MAG: ATP-binding cassette domain-containing protein [Sphaerochaetaceae bacterium]|nr:ATP-binding cassette domain-containing protein [Sphaerochaetaceae bacterium]